VQKAEEKCGLGKGAICSQYSKSNARFTMQETKLTVLKKLSTLYFVAGALLSARY
jgi:hypothetical protein